MSYAGFGNYTGSTHNGRFLVEYDSTTFTGFLVKIKDRLDGDEYHMPIKFGEDTNSRIEKYINDTLIFKRDFILSNVLDNKPTQSPVSYGSSGSIGISGSQGTSGDPGKSSYIEYLADNISKNIAYSEYLADNISKNIAYSEYLAENLNNINYGEYISDNLNKLLIKYKSDDIFDSID